MPFTMKYDLKRNINDVSSIVLQKFLVIRKEEWNL